MATVFTVSPGEAGSFQEQYQRLVETWIREFINKHGGEKLHEEKESHIRLTDGNRVVYGRVGQEFRNEITGEIVSQLEQLEATIVGGTVKGAGAKILEIDGLVVLQSNADGKVLINRFLEAELSEATAYSPDSAQKLLEKNDLELQPDSPQMCDTVAQPPQEQATSGMDIAQAALLDLPNDSLKQLLAASLAEMRLELKRQQQQGQVLEELVQQRLAQQGQTSWWQQVQGLASGAWRSLCQMRQEYSAAAAIATLFRLQVSPDSKVYQSENYAIEREGRSYNLLDKSGTTLMQFQSTPMGMRVERSTVRLIADHYRDIKQLSQQQVKGDKLFGAFAPVGQQETEYLKRVSAITKALVQHAAQLGRTVQVDGQFSYKWKATPDGSVRIDAKDGRGPLLVKHQGQLRCRMSNRDLAHFEQMLPILNSVPRLSSTKAQSRQPVREQKAYVLE